MVIPDSSPESYAVPDSNCCLFFEKKSFKGKMYKLCFDESTKIPETRYVESTIMSIECGSKTFSVFAGDYDPKKSNAN